jgi:hypothetical protein
MKNPKIKKYVDSLSFPLKCVSGITSSLITNIIAPPANAIIYGRRACEIETIPAPNSPPKISTTPVRKAIKNEVFTLYPAFSSAAATAAPSGMFRGLSK